jgi:hypothetical protein
MELRKQLLEATRAHAHGHIEKHRMNVEVYLENPTGIGEHSDILEAIEHEMMEMAKYQDVLDVLEGYFK